MKSKLFVCFFISAVTASAESFPGSYTGNFSEWMRDGSRITMQAGTSALRLEFYMPDILRVDFLPSVRTIIDSSFVVVQPPNDTVQVSIRENDSVLTVASSRIRVRCQKYPLRLSITDSTGRLLLAEPESGGMSADRAVRTVRFMLQKDDHFYGTGERGTSLDKRGQKFESYNTQVPGYGTPLATMNLNVPLLTTTNGYALFIDNCWKGFFDLGASDLSTFSYAAAGGELSWYLIAAPTIPEQLEKYTWLTGRQPLPPRWAFGFIQSKNRYENEREARSIVSAMREKQIPCDAIVLDLKWFDKMGDVSWNESAWPHHETMITDFLAQGMKTILITEPYIIQPSKNFREAEANGYLAADSAGHAFLLDSWWSCGGLCRAALLDITNPAAQHWWWSKHPSSFGTHVAGIWTDLGEPERHPEGMNHFLGSAEKIHNLYNLLWARTVFDGFNRLRPGERAVNLTRSGFAGIQRYGVLPWSGDVARSFGGLAVQLPMLLNMGMSGIAYHNSDIGGYSRMASTPELYIRWMQYGTFCPITRAHGAGETVRGFATEPWQFGAEAEKICRDYLRLRYRLLPYIYTLAHHNTETGLPLARPLFWMDPRDTTLLNESSSYMWGDAFLVSPVVTAGQTTKDVRLPHGTWFNYWTDEVIRGGSTVAVAAPLERMPLFVKAGSIIPMAPLMAYSDERAVDTVTLRMYPGDIEESSYTLYEDDGKSLAYQSGAYAQTTFTQRTIEAKGERILTLTAGPSHGAYAGKQAQRVYAFDVHGISPRPSLVRRNGARIPERSASGFAKTAGDGYYYNAAAKELFVTTLCHSDSSSTITAIFGHTDK
jgi:alpha-glucosidase (family GH31 glycosyl hydrolase)